MKNLFENMPPNPKRANTAKQKRKIVEKLLDAWISKSELRFGQFICCAVHDKDLFNIEDYDLVELVEKFAEE